MPNALTSLKADHTKVKRLLSELAQTTERGAKSREGLLALIEMELKIHSKLEEEIFYPAYKQAASEKEERDLFYEATEEHHLVDMVLPELKATSPKSEQFGAKSNVLKEIVERHIEEEESGMFVQARRLMSEEELREIGDLLKKRKETLVSQWESPLMRPLQAIQNVLEKVAPTTMKNAKAALAKRSARSQSDRERRP